MVWNLRCLYLKGRIVILQDLTIWRGATIKSEDNITPWQIWSHSDTLLRNIVSNMQPERRQFIGHSIQNITTCKIWINQTDGRTLLTRLRMAWNWYDPKICAVSGRYFDVLPKSCLSQWHLFLGGGIKMQLLEGDLIQFQSSQRNILVWLLSAWAVSYKNLNWSENLTQLIQRRSRI